MNIENIEDIYPLSPMQQGMLFHSLAAPESGEYFQQLTWTFHGRLDAPAFEQAWQRIIARHPVLRTDFDWEELEEPAQVVYRHLALPIARQDWRGLSTSQQQERLEAFLLADRQKRFDLASAPLLRLTLIQMTEEVYQFLWSYHHILLDGWSVGLILKELLTVYEALSQSRNLPQESSAPRPFRDFIAWLQRQDLPKAEAFWRQTLKGFTAPISLPIDHAPGATAPGQMETYAQEQIVLRREPTQALQALARQHQVTFSTLVHGIWGLLLSRYSGEEDVLFGAAVSGRPAELPGVETMAGMFINTLPMRVQARPQDTLGSWLKQLQTQQLERLQYEYSPLVQVQQWSEAPRSKPLFENILVFENYPVDETLFQRVGEVEIRGIRMLERTNYPLTIEAIPGQELTLRIIYSNRRFETSAITRLLKHFQTLLESAATRPQAQLSELAMLAPEERRQILTTWNDTKTDFTEEKCLHELFEAQVERTPDAVALIFQGEQLTYRALNARANQLAHDLQQLGVGPEVRVGICAERSLGMVVGILGVLKAGGAYVPLDPAYPQERLHYMLKDAQMPVLLAEKFAIENLQLQIENLKLLCLDSDWEKIARNSAENLPSTTAPANVAYAIYTSGSTGKPKGVLGLHGNTVNRLAWMWGTYPFEPEEVCCQKTSLNFVDSVWEIFGPLLKGIPTRIIPDEALKDPHRLVQTLADSHVTRIVLVPSLLRVMLDLPVDLQRLLPALKIWVTSGETLPMELCQRFMEVLPQRVLLNLYGSSEVAADVTCYNAGAWNRTLKSVPIGRPLANTKIYLLDAYLQPVPVGVAGELLVGGDALARGYLFRPELTAEKFIPNPFAEKAISPINGSTRLYKTGDLARYLPDGNIEYVGRRDYQIKLRGFRIELGEIEAALAEHPAINEIVVLAREDHPLSLPKGELRLVAYIVSKQPAVPTLAELRQFLLKKLPDYMLPSVLVPLEAMPLLPNGKVDRHALPVPGLARPELEDGFVAPRTPIEKELTDIWAEVLRLEKVGICSNFFNLGGHSLMVMQLISRLKARFGVELPVRDFFMFPTIKSLAEKVEATILTAQKKSEPEETLALTPRLQQHSAPLSFAQLRLWFLDQLEPGNAVYNIPLAIRMTGQLQAPALEQSLNEIIKRHEALRTTFALEEGQPVQVIARNLTLPLPVIDLRHHSVIEQEAEVQQRAAHEGRQSFDLARGPLLRATLLQLGEAEHVLLLVMHHIVSDNWSIGIFIQEMAAAYNAFLRGEPAALPALPIQYADFAHWQRSREAGQKNELTTQLSYWKGQLAGAPSLLELPTDRPRPAVQTFRGAFQPFSLSPTLSTALLALSQKEGVTLFMTLLAAFKALLFRYSSQHDILVGTPIANRNRADIEKLIGFFVNTLVLRTNLAGDPGFRELLGRVREVCLDAYAHQELPFEKLVEELQPDRDLSRNPLFQVMFILLNAPQSALELSGLRLTPMNVHGGTAMFDLTFTLWEEANGVSGKLEYNTDLFDAATIQRWLGQFHTLLEGIVANPAQPISALPILTPAERGQILGDWNATHRDYPREECLPQLFEAQVARAPDAVAVVFGEQQITYRELNRRANQLAHHLRTLGVGPEVMVGICLERSIEMVIGLLGILKAGGAYVPLDPAYPAERIAYVLADARVPVLLTKRATAENLSFSAASFKTILLDDELQGDGANDLNPSYYIAPENLAYAIYTSGSTGKPKGVAISHGALTNFLMSMQEMPGLAAADVLLAVTTLSFDIAGLELYLPLTTGGRVVLASHETATDGERLAAALTDSGATVMQATPATWQMLIENGWRGSPRLKMLCGGEAMPKELADQLLERGAELWNMYGPTETTIWSTLARLEKHGGALTIGRPITNTQIYILDRAEQVAPVGVHGALYIGGEGLARGYWQRPDLTAEKFTPNLHGEQPGARIYNTGDLARYLPDGRIVCLGRGDHQVKIRGFRIELGEIEAVCHQHPQIEQAVAVAREDIPGDKRLVVYFVVRVEQNATIKELRQLLSSQLPAYMMPSAFVLLEKLPLTPNGKIDRKALPPPDLNQRETLDEFVAPQTPLEKILAGIWHQVLGVARIGVHDNFFTLGGHSLLATQVNSRLRKILGFDFPLRTLFEAPTIAALAQTMTAQFGSNGKLEKIAQMLEKMNSLSPEAKQKLLAEKRSGQTLSLRPEIAKEV